MGVDLLSELDEAMLGELNGLASYHGLWGQLSGYAVLIRGSVDPERRGIYELAHEETWDAAVYSDELRIH